MILHPLVLMKIGGNDYGVIAPVLSATNTNPVCFCIYSNARSCGKVCANVRSQMMEHHINIGREEINPTGTDHFERWLLTTEYALSISFASLVFMSSTRDLPAFISMQECT